MPTFSVGDVVRNTCFGEQGRIVRLVPLADILPDPKPHQREELAYIVALPPGPHTASREALWFRSDMKADHNAGTNSDNKHSDNNEESSPQT